MKLLTYQQVSALFGIAVSTLRRLVREKRIRAVRIGYRTVRFRESEIVDFLLRNNTIANP